MMMIIMEPTGTGQAGRANKATNFHFSITAHVVLVVVVVLVVLVIVVVWNLNLLTSGKTKNQQVLGHYPQLV